MDDVSAADCQRLAVNQCICNLGVRFEQNAAVRLPRNVHGNRRLTLLASLQVGQPDRLELVRR
jgi:hypothetical protein